MIGADKTTAAAPQPNQIKETEVHDDAFYAQCHEQFGLPPFADIDILIFGYGSILWKQNFEFTKEYEVYIKDYKRVFFQGSEDHRGTPEHPGRVVTLLPLSHFPPSSDEDNDPAYLKQHSSLVREPGYDGSKYDNRVYGKAYQLPSDPRKMYEIMKALDVRESGGYDCVRVTLYDAHPQHEDTEEPLDTSKQTEQTPSPQQRGREPTKQKEVICLCYMATEKAECFLGDAPLRDMAQQMLTAVGKSGSNREYLFALEEKLKEMSAHDPHVFALANEARQILRDQGAL